MNPKKPDPVYVCDYSRMRTVPPHSPEHWLFALLQMISFAGALWLHGHAGLTLGLLAAVPLFAAAVYVPYRWFGSLARAITNCVLFGCALGWSVWRMKAGLPDLILVEGLCIVSLMFIAGGRRKDYFYLFFICVFLLIYGALVPRLSHLYLTGIAAVLLFVMAIRSRSTVLAGGKAVKELPSRWFRHWHPVAVQLILSGVLFWYIFALMPLQDNEVPGLFETSFLTKRETVLPPEVGEWLRPKKVKESSQGGNIDMEKTQSPPTATGEKGKPADISAPKQPKSIIEGSGSASQGEELVFCVKSPVKLYHLARLYDQYDGAQWKATPRLERVKIRQYGENSPVRWHMIDQKYTLAKLISKRLYAGFMPVSYTDETAMGYFQRKIRTSFYGAELLQTPASLPLSYSVSVQLTVPLRMPELTRTDVPPAPPQAAEKKPAAKGRKQQRAVRKPDPPDPAWRENISRRNYTSLPGKKISARVRKLAAGIATPDKTPYGQALALRDYLRKNYPYKLKAAPVPPGREPADYFLFELKEGHCEYFACALAVLARAAGLPARVATGFSPGNYNTLTGQFEVYEYHAHAWTQVYIERLGWLTLDATPPSEISSRTVPAGIGQLRDPFDDEWRITPPELTEKTQNFLKLDLLEKVGKEDKLSKIDSTLVEMVKAQEKIQQKVQQKYETASEKINESRQNGLLRRLNAGWEKMKRQFIRLFMRGYDFLFSSWLVLLSGLLLAGVVGKLLAMGISGGIVRRRLHIIGKLRRQAESLRETDPRQAVLKIYSALRRLLELRGYERGSSELLDYAGRVAETDLRLGESARVIFLLYYKAEYSARVLRPADAEKAIGCFDAADEKN